MKFAGIRDRFGGGAPAPEPSPARHQATQAVFKRKMLEQQKNVVKFLNLNSKKIRDQDSPVLSSYTEPRRAI